MRWAIITVCVMFLAMLGTLGWLLGEAADWVNRPEAKKAQAEHDARMQATNAALANLQAQSRSVRNQLVKQMQQEFGAQVDPGSFTSHHTANDYLERLRLAREAAAEGLQVDPNAFGDDEFMRRHIEALRQGSAVPTPARKPTGAAMGMRPPAQQGDYMFVNGHRYYANGQGSYVRADGTVLDPVGARTGGQAGVVTASATPAPGSSLLDPEALADMNLDELLEMAAPLLGEQ